MRVFSLPAAALLVVAATGCASGGAGQSSEPTTRWTGSFQPQQQRTGAVAPTGTNRVFGTVSIVPSARSDNYSRFTLMLNAPAANTTYRWAMQSGRCGSASLPVIAFDQFPMLEVSSNGRAQLDLELPVTFPTSGTYHVAIFWRNGTDLSDIVTCANLRT